MNATDYDRISAELIAEAARIESAKRPAYAVGSPDVLANFKSVAARAGISPMQAWAVYFLKHIDAITAIAKDPEIPQAEGIEGRFADAINYLKLGWAILSETGRRAYEMPPDLPPYEPLDAAARLKVDPDAIEYLDDATGKSYVHTYGTAYWRKGRLDIEALRRSGITRWRLRPDIAEGLAGYPDEGRSGT